MELDSNAGRRCSAALVEAVDNAIFHAHNGKAEKKIRIKIKVNSEMVLMEVEDGGPGFDPDNVPPPKLSAVHGRGIYIIKAMMDEVEYKENILRMTSSLSV